MRLTRVEIENFRCIDHISVDLDDTTVLIGENNSGKTAFLDAVRLCLDPPFGRKRRPFEEYDYRFSAERASPAEAPPIRIELTFAERVPEEWPEDVRQDFREVIDRDSEDRARIRLRVTSSFRSGTEWEFLTETGEPTARPRLVDRVRHLAPAHYLSALRDAEQNFASRGRYWRAFLDESGIPDRAREDLERELHEFNTQVVEMHQPLASVREQLEVVKKVLDFAAADAVSVDALPTKLFALLSGARVSLASRSGAHIPVTRQGQGTQSLAVLALFAAFLSSRRDAGEPQAVPITALEEPEAHLHPAAARALMRIVDEIPGQKLIATHSGDLMAQVSTTQIRRFAPEGSGVAVHRIAKDGLTPEETGKLDLHVKHVRGELLFARCWLLVEGETEEILFAGVARAMGRDLDREGVRPVKFAGAGPQMFVKAAEALGIRWHCVVDDDGAGRGYRRSIARVVGTEVAAPRVASPYVSPEACLLEAGFDELYERRTTGGDRAASTHREAPKVVARGKSKPAAAAKAVKSFEADPGLIPEAIRGIVSRVLAVAGEV